jgi:hypothetical protein
MISVVTRLPLFALLLSACGASAPTAVMPGDADALPSMECLPGRGVELDELSESARFAWLLTEQSFELERPHPAPRGATHAELQAWSETELRGWLREKSRLVEAARAELDEVAEEAHRQRVWSGALVGLMYEDVARTLLDVPVPRELLDEPEIATAFRDVVRAEASPYLEHARRAYRACRLNGRNRDGALRTWAEFCADRGDRLPLAEALESGESTTEVEVVHE